MLKVWNRKMVICVIRVNASQGNKVSKSLNGSYWQQNSDVTVTDSTILMCVVIL